jgi:hypothetical protein
MHILGFILDRVSGLFRFNNHPLGEKAYSVMFNVAGLSLRDLREVLGLLGRVLGGGSTSSKGLKDILCRGSV